MKYLWLTLKHKWFVLVAGIRLRVPLWRLITHDLSKLTPSELSHYNRQFFGNQGNPLGFVRAWLHHQNVNDHHPEYWIPRSGHTRGGAAYGDGKPIPMPEPAVREMVADWLAAGRAYEGKWPDLKNWQWWSENRVRLWTKLHQDTWSLLLGILKEIGLQETAP